MALPTVALLIETSRAYGRGLCSGIAAFAHAHGEWNFSPHEWDLGKGIPDWLASWKGDGIICRISDPELADVLANISCPVVDIYGQIRHSKIPYLDTDADAIADMAVRFFLDAAFDHFAFCGFPGLWFSDDRSLAFTHKVQRMGFPLTTYNPPHFRDSTNVAVREALHANGSPELERWVLSLPPRTAVLACNDVRARQLLAVAIRVGLRVPEDFAVVGVDNDEVICEMTNPRLTSIRPDTYGLGYTAAHWLHLMMNGEQPPTHSLQITPLGICERASSDVVASDDPLFVRAVRFIRSNVKAGIDVKAVIDHVGCSRSTLDGRFKHVLGRSIKDEITRVKVMGAKILLRETRLPLDQIANACGFATASHFSRIFKEMEDLSPGRFRNLFSHHAADPGSPSDEDK